MATKLELEKELKEKDKALESLQKQMEQLMAQVQLMASAKTVEPRVETTQKDLSTKKIKIISLIDNPLNLSTEQGRKYELPSYGASRMVRYDDLESIVVKCHKFLNCFYICNKEAVEELGLEEIYNGMVDKNTMDKITDLQDQNSVDMFKGLTKKLQENAEDIIIEKINRGQKFDQNYLYAINVYLNKDLNAIAKERKELLS